MRDDLTPRQREIYECLRRRRERSEPPPTLDELARALGLRSRGSLHKQVRALVEAGLVEPMAGRRRGVRLTAPPDGAPASHEAGSPQAVLALLGRIAAGRPIEAIEVPEEVEVPAGLLGRRACYALAVRGDSMTEDGILDGDMVIVEHRTHADNGEVVVALIDGEEATLKRIEQRSDTVVLHPAHHDMAPMSYAPERVRIQGVAVGLIRRYR
ncbi:MAG: transcriptional repressor LexA [Gammaproteobacteria bacterium]|nr:transcriptional repressor LexA [Gammaproteobacteria bacterium]NIR83852.1 transcriptional repressor LexA [Gammaproteobacteria bacterium]NIU04152.1 transcriptional repressor LexA [Gammaproteobacteria bacterium]NIX85426.1 transcriptional repressor LexA [Gammaproteobacteria bacterium]